MSGRPGRGKAPDGAWRRLALTLAVYGVGAAILLRLLPAFQRLLLLPALFPILVKGALVAGVPVVCLLAWRYPKLGGGGEGE